MRRGTSVMNYDLKEGSDTDYTIKAGKCFSKNSSKIVF